jgi:hypothetical protein
MRTANRAARAAIATGLLLCSAPLAAKDLVKTVSSGERVLMYRYAHWLPDDCSPDLGDVKVLAKPQHGKLTPVRGTLTIPATGTRNPSPIKCIGKPTPMFAVYYTSHPGFRGVDSFRIEVNYRRQRLDFDTFTIYVR